ncbi:MAG TPA: ABC transporter permease [Polyangiaceae bacterium]|nr:ABC transporter permease [Polyangiaceae bacterium]
MASPLGLLLAIAWRNLGRNRRRTLIAGGGIALGVGMCVAGFGVMDGMSGDMVRSITDTQLGHVQVHEPGFSARPKLDLAFEQANEHAQKAEQLDGVQAASARVIGWALVSGAQESVGVQLLGVDPKRENALTHLERHVVGGDYLGEAATPWPHERKLTDAERALDQRLTERAAEQAAAEITGLGNADAAAPAAAGAARSETQRLLAEVAPKPSHPPPVLLGEKLANKLHVQPGAGVDVTGTDVDGNPVNVEFRVLGILRTGDASLDSTRAVAHIADTQRLFGLGNRAHELALRLREPSQTARVAEKLAQEPSFRGLDVRTWQQLRPDVVAMVRTNGSVTAIMVMIIFAVAAVGVADTILMAVFERRRELGVLKAVGMRPLAIVVMVAVETLTLAIGASLAGLALGLGIDLFLARWGIPLGGLSGFSMAGAAIPPVLHATVTKQGVLLPLALMIAMALLASLWPALIAARIEPVLAMRGRSE